MIEVGRLCIKIAGRDAGKKCVIVEVLDDSSVLIDGETRRRKCNMKHIELLTEQIKIKKGASHQDIMNEFQKLGIELKETKPRKPKPKQNKIRAAERKKMAPKEDLKKAAKKEKAAKEPGKESAEAESTAEKKETKLEKAISEEQ